MRALLQLCLLILVLLSTRSSSWGRMACHDEPATVSQAFIWVNETDPDAPPMGVSSGGWHRHDATGFEDGPNVYAYVRQNPWTAFDPDGLAEESPSKSKAAAKPKAKANTPHEKTIEASAVESSARMEKNKIIKASEVPKKSERGLAVLREFFNLDATNIEELYDSMRTSLKDDKALILLVNSGGEHSSIVMVHLDEKRHPK